MVSGTAFSDQANAVGVDDNFSTSAAFTPRALPARALPTGIAVECRAIVVRTDPKIPLGIAGARNPGWTVLVKRSEIPDAPRSGDEIEITEGRWLGSYIVMTPAELPFSPYWRFQVRAA